MRCVGFGLAVSGIAVAAFAGAAAMPDHADLHIVGGVLGAALGLAGTFLGFHRHGNTQAPRRKAAAAPLLPRDFPDRRSSPRHAVQIPVRVSVNGHAFTASLLNVGSGGALLRVPAESARSLRDQVGQPVCIHDYPAGSLTRVGSRGMYVEFAVAFEHASAGSDLESARSAS